LLLLLLFARRSRRTTISEPEVTTIAATKTPWKRRTTNDASGKIKKKETAKLAEVKDMNDVLLLLFLFCFLLLLLFARRSRRTTISEPGVTTITATKIP